ncbi:rhodanese-related sulfurtransferase [Citricoccus sp. SGAir0253]|uniref:oxygen-dependent tRNA uridine(34) hydroxylase TrhO n=1 Tax=Citricoccus sp. SGAir0253 TaxID=2567881 RepID=UPI0010CD1FC9|nr:rhodanese-related sulfurtransferase [Citricoccus sp. SGAir0253]QCU77349.1 rhodanese-related sulfurtransferase [Citricoccus sp. SGAir0253]
MSQSKIALYYRFAPVADPEAVRLWQSALAERWGLRGRIIVSPQGLNGTVGGPLDAVKQYLKATRAYPAFAGLDVKWSDGSAEDFPRLSVKVRPELVAFDAADEVTVTADGVEGAGTHVGPAELHRLVEERSAAGDPVVFFDGRNAVEARIGRFRGAVVPDTTTTRDFVAELDSGRYDHLKDRPVVTYCTGGVRCEVLSALMRRRGFAEVYQLEGGIARYGEAYGDGGLWEGSLAVFDRRMRVEFSDRAAVVGRCSLCAAPTADLRNCADPSCRTLDTVCAGCAADRPERVCPACAAVAS